MATVTISPNDVFVCFSVYRLKALIDKDSVDWPLTGATVDLFLRKPDGTLLSNVATISDAATGEVYWDTTTATFDVAGLWKASWRVTLGSIVQETQPIPLTVVDSP